MSSVPTPDGERAEKMKRCVLKNAHPGEHMFCDATMPSVLSGECTAQPRTDEEFDALKADVRRALFHQYRDENAQLRSDLATARAALAKIGAGSEAVYITGRNVYQLTVPADAWRAAQAVARAASPEPIRPAPNVTEDEAASNDAREVLGDLVLERIDRLRKGVGGPEDADFFQDCLSQALFELRRLRVASSRLDALMRQFRCEGYEASPGEWRHRFSVTLTIDARANETGAAISEWIESGEPPEPIRPAGAETDLAHKMANDLGIDGLAFDATAAAWEKDFSPFEKGLHDSQHITAADMETRVGDDTPAGSETDPNG